MDFEDAWERYLGADDNRDYNRAGDHPCLATVTPLQAAPDAASSDFLNITTNEAVTVQKSKTPPKRPFCNAVTLSRPSTEAETNGMEEEL